MRHLGPRVAPLVDGRMTPAEEERAWTHVHGCPLCADAVQREGWIKRQLAGLSHAEAEPVPEELRGSLCNPLVFAAYPTEPPADGPVPPGRDSGRDSGGEQEPGGRPRRVAGLAVFGAGSVSAAMMGVVALGVAPANAPGMDLRVPATTTQPSAPITVTRGREKQPAGTGRVDAGLLARQVAVTVGASMSMGR